MNGLPPPTHKNGQRVTAAVLVPIILNTYGGIGEKAIEFFYAIAGNDAKRIMDEISLLAVLLSAEMILASHAPSNLENLVAYREKKPPVVPEEPEILRPDLRGEIQGNRSNALDAAKRTRSVSLYLNFGTNIVGVHT